MKPSKYIRLLVIAMVAAASLVLFSYSRASQTVQSECVDYEKCNLQQPQAELMIWESLSHNLLGNSR